MFRFKVLFMNMTCFIMELFFLISLTVPVQVDQHILYLLFAPSLFAPAILYCINFQRQVYIILNQVDNSYVHLQVTEQIVVYFV